MDCSNRNPIVLTLQNVLLQSDLDYGSQNPHYTKNLIYVVKTPIIESDLYCGGRTPTIGYYLYNSSRARTVGFDLNKKVRGNHQIAEGTMVTKEC